MNNYKGQKSGQRKKEVSYDEAMKQAFDEIFQNIKMIKDDTKRLREEVFLQRRRGSAPPAMLRKTTAQLQHPQNELARSLSEES